MKKPAFNGRETLERQKAKGLKRRLVGIAVEGRRVARKDMVIEANGRPVGRVTSGSFGPSLERPIALGYVETALAKADTPLDIVAGTSRLAGRVTPVPFYTKGSRRT
jgi:aminomethyltransferase